MGLLCYKHSWLSFSALKINTTFLILIKAKYFFYITILYWPSREIINSSFLDQPCSFKLAGSEFKTAYVLLSLSRDKALSWYCCLSITITQLPLSADNTSLSGSFLKSINQSSIKPCLIVHLVAVWTLLYYISDFITFRTAITFRLSTGATSIAEAIKVIKFLTNLNLSRNGIGDVGATFILLTQSKSTRLSTIWIGLTIVLVMPMLHFLLRK